MATLTEAASWTAGIYQLETTDPVLGGPDGIDNLQAKQLANRTLWLKEQVESLVDGKQPVDATLTALAGVTTAADQIIYATGSDSFAVTPLTAFIRTLLDDVDAAAARTSLGAAPVANPAFNGTPTAPTAPQGTGNTQLATTLFVQTAVSGRRQLFTSSGSFTVPAGVTTIWVSACAGGGGGGGSFSTTNNSAAGAGGGGAGQSLIKASFAVTPGDVLAASIGAGGTTGVLGGNGGNAGNTSLGSLFNLQGGFGGGAGGSPNATNSNGGIGGAGFPGGSYGTDSGAALGGGAMGGAGGSSPFGGGGRSAKGNGGNANSGAGGGGYGSGGSGAAGITGNVTATGSTGGAGAPGFILIEW